MNPDNIIAFLQQGFHITLGAATSVVESLQDDRKREENFTKLQSAEWSELSRDWEQKGEITEREARNFVENIWGAPAGSASSTADPASTAASPTAGSKANLQREIQELTEHIAALRSELEKLQEEKAS